MGIIAHHALDIVGAVADFMQTLLEQRHHFGNRSGIAAAQQQRRGILGDRPSQVAHQLRRPGHPGEAFTEF